MSFRCLVFGCMFLVAHSAIIKSRNIPVEVVYDKGNPLNYANRNLDAKIQLSPEDLLRLKLSDDILNEGTEEAVTAQVDEITNGIKNMEEKVQLSPDEVSQNMKLIANVEAKSAESHSENSFLNLLKKAEEVAYSGISNIRNNIETASEAVANAKPNEETWEKLNQTLDGFFQEQYKRINLKQGAGSNNQTNQVWESFVNNFQSTVQNWMNNFQQQQQQQGGSEDEQQPTGGQNPFQNVVSFFQNGWTQVVNNMNNLNQNGTSATGQEDTGSGGSNGSNNFFGNVVSSVQQFFQGQGGNPAQAGNNQSDTGVQQPSNPAGFFQGAFQQVISNFNLNPSSTTKAPAVQGDEGVASSSTTPSSNFIGGINQAFQNFVGQGSNGSIGGQFGQVLGGQGQGGNPIQSGAQAIGGQFGQFTGQNGSNPISSAIGGQFGQFTGQNGSNPISGIGGQFGQLAGQFGGQNGSSPISSGAQAIGGQFGQFAGQFGGQNGSNPIASGAEAIGGQFGQFAGQGGNPLGNIPGIPGGNQSSNPFASGAQAIGSQFGQFTGGNGSNPISSAVGQFTGGQGGSNPIASGAQAIGGQIGQIGGGNYLGSTTQKTRLSEEQNLSLEPVEEEKKEVLQKVE